MVKSCPCTSYSRISLLMWWRQDMEILNQLIQISQTWRLKSPGMLRNFRPLQVRNYVFSSRHRATLRKVWIFTNAAIRTAGLRYSTVRFTVCHKLWTSYNKVYVRNWDQIITYYFYSPDLSLDITTTMRHGSPVFISRRCRRFFSSSNGPERLESSPSWVQPASFSIGTEGLSVGGGCEVNYPSLSSDVFKNERRYISTPPIGLYGLNRENFTFS